MSKPKYTDPNVAYNTGYNDGAREERDRILKAIAGDPSEPEKVCSLCHGAKKIRWGRADRAGGEMGPCICTPEGRSALGEPLVLR